MLEEPPHRTTEPRLRGHRLSAHRRECCASSTPKTAKWPRPWRARSPPSRAPWTPSSTPSDAAGGCSTSAPAPAAGWACSTPPRCPPTFGADPGMVQGIIAGGEAALSRATESHRRRSRHRRRATCRPRLHRRRRPGGNRRQRPHALRAGRHRRSPQPGRGHRRNQLHARFRTGARRRHRRSLRWRAPKWSPAPRA